MSPIFRIFFILGTLHFHSCMVNAAIEINAVTPRMKLGEGPLWDYESEKLYFVDIENGKIKSYIPKSGELYSSSVNSATVAFVLKVKDKANEFIVGSGKNVTLISWDGESNESVKVLKNLLTVDLDRNTRFNDAKIDSQGRFWGGTMSLNLVNNDIEPNKGTLYSIDENLNVKKQLSPVSVSNGVAWNAADDQMYFIDSPTKQVVAYDFNAKTGVIENPKVAFDFNAYNISGVPDGMSIDTDDNLWVAAHNAGSVIKVDPRTGKLLQTVAIPVKRVTSVAFGGPLLDVLYVTTATGDKDEPNGGSLFEVKGLGVRGLAPNDFKLNEN